LPPEPGGLGTHLSRLGSLRSVVADLADLGTLRTALFESRAEVVLHLAAQALVLPSYEDPVGTFATNVMGTAHLLEAVRHLDTVRACVVVTSDKCYATGPGAHLETDPLGGSDPYSASKAAAELVTQAYRSSFAPAGGALATARAGNILGGGDVSIHRIVPDWARALEASKPLHLRRPDAVRPWQHVLDAAGGYLRLGAALLDDGPGFAGAWNFGPSSFAPASVGELVGHLFEAARHLGLDPKEPISDPVGSPPERSVLTLDSRKAEQRLAWRQALDLAAAARWTVEWYATCLGGDLGPTEVTAVQIEHYLELEGSGSAMPETASR